MRNCGSGFWTAFGCPMEPTPRGMTDRLPSRGVRRQAVESPGAGTVDVYVSAPDGIPSRSC